jgi:hypothetical protein
MTYAISVPTNNNKAGLSQPASNKKKDEKSDLNTTQ